MMNKCTGRQSYLNSLVLSRLLHPDIVHFHFPCLGTEIFLRELTLSNTLSSNPTNFIIVQLHEWMTTNDYVTQRTNFY
jgi:hypothetical protein